MPRLGVNGRVLIRRAENVVRDRDREVQPHAKQPQPCGDLHPASCSWSWHASDGFENLARVLSQAGFSGLHSAECFHILGRIFLRRDDGPYHAPKKAAAPI